MSRPFQETDTSNPTYALKSKLTDTVNLKKLQFTQTIYFTNASLKRKVLTLHLKEAIRCSLRMWYGNVFQSLGAAIEKDLSPSVDNILPLGYSKQGPLFPDLR